MRDSRWESVYAQIFEYGLFGKTDHLMFRICIPKQNIECQILVSPEELESHPATFGWTLDKMVEGLDKDMDDLKRIFG